LFRPVGPPTYPDVEIYHIILYSIKLDYTIPHNII